MTWPDSLAPLRHRNFAWYFGSRFADTLGTMMAGVALTFAVLDINDSPTALGQVLAAHTVPMVVLLLAGGVIADRVPRTLLLQTSNVAAALSQGLLAALIITESAELWMVIVLAGVNGTVDAMSFPAQASMVPQLVDRAQLQPANALLSMSRGALTVVAPSLAALLTVAAGPGWALAVNALMWLLAAAALTGVRTLTQPRRSPATSTLGDLREGWTTFAGTTWLWVVVLAFSALNTISSGAWLTVGPVVARDAVGTQGWGLVLSAQSAGLLLMTLLLLRMQLRRPLLTGMLGVSLLSLPILVLGAHPHLVALLVVAFIAGAGIEVFNIGWNVAIQENIEDRLLSRVYSYDALGSLAAVPVGQLVYGPLADLWGHRDVLMWSAVAYAVLALLTLTSQAVRTLDRAGSATRGEEYVQATTSRPAGPR